MKETSFEEINLETVEDKKDETDTEYKKEFP